MPSLGKTIASLARQRRQWEAMVRLMPRLHAPLPEFGPAPDHLTEVTDFGSNPGALRMFKYVPADPQPALVVVLHGCAQTAASYDLGAGWSTLSDRYGFALLLPEQTSRNNPKRCFNWFLLRDIQRGRGEALSIRQMIERMIVDHGIDRRRVFITGLSAGGAMTSVMLATYPDTFAAGAIIAGLPYGTASNAKEAFESMFEVREHSPREWGDRVRAASTHPGPWPRISVWHGGADETVKPGNAEQIIRQWADVHGLDVAPSATERVDGYPRRVWRDHAGETVIEAYTIPTMAHGTPLATGPADEHCGVAGDYLLEVGISSSYHIARFWGLTGWPRRVLRATLGTLLPQQPAREPTPDRPAPPARVDSGRAAEETSPRSRTTGVQAIIAKALTAAGLIKA